MDCSPPGPSVHGILQARVLPRVCSNSYALSWWCYLTISSSVAPFPSCHQSFPASRSFPMSWLFPSGGQRIRASASASVLPMNIQSWFPLRLTGLISLQSTELSRVLELHNLKASVFWCSAFFMVQLSSIHDYWKNHSFGRGALSNLLSCQMSRNSQDEGVCVEDALAFPHLYPGLCNNHHLP